MTHTDDRQGLAPNHSVTIRRASPADAAGIASVVAAIAAERVYSAIDRPWSVEEQERYLASLSARDAIHVAIHATEGVVGFQSVERYSPMFPSMAHVGQCGTFLLPHWRRRGIGRLLWRSTRTFADEAGYRKLVIMVRGANANAQAFYQGLGFRVCGRLTAQVVIDGVADDEVVMEQFL